MSNSNYHYSIPQQVDYSKFAPTNTNPETLYGLPQDIQFCSRCVISNQRPNSAVEYQHTKASKKATINLDAEHVCDACKQAERKHQKIDWDMREQQLRELCDKHRS